MSAIISKIIFGLQATVRAALQLGQYTLEEKIGEGGMGAVYEAVHVRLSKRRFAIKILKAMQTGSTTPYARFKREAEIATELGHPNIVDVLDFYETEDGRPCMVMELLLADQPPRGTTSAPASSGSTPMTWISGARALT